MSESIIMFPINNNILFGGFGPFPTPHDEIHGLAAVPSPPGRLCDLRWAVDSPASPW